LDEDELEELKLGEELKKNVYAGMHELQRYFNEKNPLR
jgi:hypothetical protein